MRLVVRQAVQTKPDVPADLIPFLMAAAVLVHDVNLVVTHLLQTGVPSTQPVTAIAAKTELSNLVIHVAAVQVALQEEAPVVVLSVVIVLAL